MQRENSATKSIAFLLGLLLSTVVVFFIYSQALIMQLSNYSEEVIGELNKSANEAYRALGMLNQEHFEHCSEQNLLFMRRLQFESSDIKDIGFFKQNHIICTTGSGVLDSPIYEGVADHETDGRRYWFNHKLKTFDDTLNGVVIKEGNYNIVLSFQSVLLDRKAFKNFEIVALMENEPKHLKGQEDIFKDEARVDGIFIKVGLLSHQLEFCGETELICIAIKQNNFAEFKTLPLLMSVAVMLLLSGFSTVHIYTDIQRYLNSNKRRIKRGLHRDKFTPNYQAIIDISTGKTIGCEMLARFEDSIGPIYPNDFIPLVSAIDQSWSFTEQLIKQALIDFEHLGTVEHPFYLSINIFPKDINNQNVLRALALLKDSPPHLEFSFEITEDEELDFTVAQTVLNKLVAAGIRVSIDDFGTGYSNMSQLKSFPIDTLKIDKSFVDEVETGSIRSTLIPNIVSIANKLNARIIAEGVENELQVAALLKMDITLAQGWYFSKAMPITEFKRYLASNNDF
jgi:sensor c-di-GMP phosphodiesterase-like protein